MSCPFSGDFADALGEDYLGLRELGIAAEFGMTSLSIPKKLLKGRMAHNKPAAYVLILHYYGRKTQHSFNSAKPTEPPPPYPPPSLFIPLSAADVDDQIGLLKPYYQSRFSALAAPASHSVETVPSSSGPPGSPIAIDADVPLIPTLRIFGTPPHSFVDGMAIPISLASSQTPLVLPDDTPNLAQTKMGPLGQIVKSNPATGTKKKKGAAPGVGVGGPAGGGGMGTEVASTPRKKKATTMNGVGSGNGRKKKAMEGGGEVAGPPAALPRVITAAPMQMVPSLGQ